MAIQSTKPVISTIGASVSEHSHSFITSTTHTTNNNNSTVRQLSPRSQNLLFLPDPEEAQTSPSSSVMAGSPTGVQTYSHTQAQSHSEQRLSKENVPVSQTRTSSQSQRQGSKVELESSVLKSINPPSSRPSKKRRLEPYVLIPTVPHLSTATAAPKPKPTPTPTRTSTAKKKKKDNNKVSTGAPANTNPARSESQGVLAKALFRQFAHNNRDGYDTALGSGSGPRAGPGSRLEGAPSSSSLAGRGSRPSGASRKRKRRDGSESELETHESTPDELLLCPGSPVRPYPEVGSRGTTGDVVVVADESHKRISAWEGEGEGPGPGGLSCYEAPLRDADADADADDGVMGNEIGVGDRSFSGDGERQSGTVLDRIGDAVDGNASSSRSGTPPHAEEDVTEERGEEREEEEEDQEEAEGAQGLAGPRRHVFLRPSQALTTPSNQLRLRAILKSALEAAEEKVRAGVGRYTPPAGWEGLCRVPGRVPNETRGEGRAQRYVSILEDAYGDGDWKRGHRKKPIKMKESLLTVEVPSEDDSESDDESVVSSLVDVGTSGAAHEEEPSDSSSSDPPHPITPPDEPLLSASVNVIESRAIAGEEGAVNAQIVVDNEGNNHDHDEEARFSEKKPFAERDSPDDVVHVVPGLQGAPGAPLVPFGAVDPRKPGHTVPVVTTTHPSGAGLVVVKRGGGDGDGQRSLDSEGQAQIVSSASSSGMVKTISSERRGLGSDSNDSSGRKGGGSSSKGDNLLPRRPANESLARNQDLNDVGKRAGRPSGLAAPPVHHIRWFDTEEWKATFRRLVSGKRRVEIEDLLRANKTIELLEQMVKALPEEAGKKLIDNVAEYLTLMKDLPEGYIPYDDQFGLRKRSADVLRAVSGVH